MKVNSNRIIIFLLIITTQQILSNCSKEAEREQGLKLASEGNWSKAIEILEKYVNSTAKDLPPVSKAEESLFDNVDLDKFYNFLEATFYLLASYLGEAGLDFRNTADEFIKASELDINKEDFECELSKITKKILSDKKELQKQIFNLYKAQRIYEKVMFGDGKRLEETANIPNYGNISVNPDENTKKFEIKRMINSIEYISGKILVWRTILSSVIMKHPDHYIQKTCEGKKPKNPSMCCILKQEWPYEKEKQKILDLEKYLIIAIRLIKNGTYGEEPAEFLDSLAEKYSELEGRLFNSFQKSASSICEKYSLEFQNTITQSIIEQIYQQGITVESVETKPGVDRENGIWVCPRKIDEEELENMYMCESSTNWRKVSEKILEKIKDIPFPQDTTIYFQIYDDVECFDCKTKNSDCQQEKERAIYIKIFVSKPTEQDKENIYTEICNNLEYQSNISGDELKINIKKLVENAVKEILESREDPVFCF